MATLNELAELFQGDPELEEIPVGVQEFVTSPKFLNQPALSDIQYTMVEVMSQIYTLQTMQRVYTDGTRRYKQFTKNEVVLQLGKGCMTADAEIYVPADGTWRTHGSLQHDVASGTCSGVAGNKIKNQYRTETFSKGMSDIYTVKTSKGLTVRVSPDHRFVNEHGYVLCKELQVGDRIAVAARLSVESPQPLDIREVKLLGYWLGDGCMPVDAPKKHVLNMDFGYTDAQSLDEYLQICSSYGETPYVKDKFPKKMTIVRHGKSSVMLDIVRKHGLYGKRAHNKRIPPAIWSLPDEQLGIFLGRLWGTDGTIYWKKNGKKQARPTLEYSTISYGLAVDIQRLLVRFGIVAGLRKKPGRYKKDGRIHKTQDSYVLTISDKIGVERFAKHISMTDKQTKLNDALSFYVGRKSQSHYNEDIYLDKVISIHKEVVPAEVFTSTAVDTGNYVANLVLNGNSGK